MNFSWLTANVFPTYRHITHSRIHTFSLILSTKKAPLSKRLSFPIKIDLQFQSTFFFQKQ